MRVVVTMRPDWPFQVVDSAPARALVPRMETTTIGQLDPTLSSDVCTHVGALVLLKPVSLLLEWYLSPKELYQKHS